MKGSGLLMSVLGSSLLLGGAMFTVPHVTHNAGVWYLAGQVKMALGDTAGGLQLMSRAAKERQHQQGIEAPVAKPSSAQAKSCSKRKDAAPAMVTPMPKMQRAKARVAVPKPKLMLSSFVPPSSPFVGRDVTGMTPAQLKLVTAKYEAEVQRWVAEQREHRIEIATLQRMDKAALKAHRSPMARGIVQPGYMPAPPLPPQVNE